MIIQNKGYAPGLALGRCGVSLVSQWRLWDLLLHKDLLLELVVSDGHDLRQLILYMHAMMMQHFNIKATTTLKIRIHMPSY